MEPWGTIKSTYDGMLERLEHLPFLLNREMWLLLCVEQSLDPQAEAGVATVAGRVFIVQKSQRNKLKITSHG